MKKIKKLLLSFFKMILFLHQLISNKHFLNAVTISNQYQTNVIPVVNETNEFIGTIAGQELLAALGNFSGANETGAVIVLEMERSRFSISEISRIVESDGAVILHLNITIKPEYCIAADYPSLKQKRNISYYCCF